MKTPPANGDIDHTIDSLISALIRKQDLNTLIPDIENFAPFRKVITEYLNKKHPPKFDNLQHKDAFQAPQNYTTDFYFRLAEIKLRIDGFNSTGGVSWDKAWKVVQIIWADRKIKLEKLLNEAADLIDSGQLEYKIWPSVNRNNEAETAIPVPAEDISCCDSIELRKFAKIIHRSPLTTVFPAAEPHPSNILFNPENIKSSGGASNPEGAFRGFIVREVAQFVPITMKNRCSVISKLAKFVGLDVDPHYVRSLLKKGKTSKTETSNPTMDQFLFR